MHKKCKDANDNAWAASHNLESNNQSNNNSKTKKSDKDNEWVSTNKN
ncbi:hypothetical protein [Cellulosilyticum sp. I15G10I2]|nr:hypothetical protein [Cellulosilyticum sp. I15G10I2]